MNIALLVDSLGFGGAQRQIVNLAVELKKQGHKISFLRYRRDDFYLPLLNENGIKPITIEEGNLLVRAWRIRKMIHALAPSTVISFMDAPNVYACIASIGQHPWRLLISERVANENAFLGWRGRLLKWFQGKYSDRIVCNSKCAEELWKKYFPQFSTKMNTIYNIIDVPHIKTEYSTDGKCRILIAARYEPVKNVSGMIEAVSLLTPAERERLEIHWYGKANVVKDGLSDFEKGKALVKELGLSDCIFLHPATDQIYPLIAKTDFIGLFSFAEGFPNSIIEGMSYKKPVIMSRVSDYNVIVDEENGFLFDQNVSEDIAAALRCAIHTTHAQREAMGQCSYEKIQKKCSVSAVVEQWNALLNWKH